LRDELGQEALKACQDIHQGHLLQVPPMKTSLKSRWREAVWIDLIFAVDHAGEKVNYNKYSQTDQRLAGIRDRTNSYFAHWVPVAALPMKRSSLR